MTVKRTIFFWLLALTVIALPVQCVIDPSSENIATACIAVASAVGVVLYVGLSGGLEDQPLSTLALLGLCVTTHLGALLVQTAARTPLRIHLYSPLTTFATIVLYQWIAVGTHAVFRYFSVPNLKRHGVLRGLMAWLGLYRTPSVTSLWFMAAVGLASFFAGHRPGIVGKVGQAFNFLVCAPFLIPFYMREIGQAYCDPKRTRVMLVGYVGVIAVLGLALNARQFMLIGVLTIGLIYLFAGMRSTIPVTQRMVIRFGILFLVLAMLAAPLSDLATSMAIARSWRGKISPVAMIQTTFDVWKRPELIAAYQAEGAAVSRFTAYDEQYISNPGMARLVWTKFIDNALHFAGTLKSEDSKQRLRDVSARFVIAVLPAPVLRGLRIRVDKEAMDYSMGDYLAFLSRGVPLGGRKTGSILAQGQALFGVFFPIIYGYICLLLYGAMSLLTIRHPGRPSTICALGTLLIWDYFYTGLHFESLHGCIAYFARNFEQQALIYALVFGLARLVERTTQALLGYRSPPRWQQPA